jgi:hypothetical protein
MFIGNDQGKIKARAQSSMRWFRFYNEALDDPKVQRLAPHLFKAWVNLLCLASKEQGAIPSDDDIAFRLRISVADAAQQVSDLILAGLVDLLPDGSRVPHNWEERQYPSDTSAARMRKYRKTKKKTKSDVTGDVTCAVGDAKSDALEERREDKIREERKEHCAVVTARCAVSTEELDQQFEEFWKAFPSGRKKGKGRAKVLFRQIARGGHHTLKASAESLITAAKAYAATKPDPQYTPMPQTWLAGGRWEDENTQTAAAPAKVEYHYPAWYLEEMASMNGGRA